MKKVLIFSLAYYPSAVSGAEVAVREITDRIDPGDIAFHMVTLRFSAEHPAEERIGNVQVHRVGPNASYLSKILFIPRAALAARRLHKQHHFDAFWSLMTYMLFPVVLTKLLGVRIPHILTLQDGDSYEKVFKRWFIVPVAPLLDYGFRHAAIIQTISHYLATWPPQRGYRGNVEVIHNGADPTDLTEQFDEQLVAQIQQRFNKQPGDVWLVNTARLEPQKATNVTLHALAQLPEYIKFLVVGDGREREMLEKLARELGIEQRVFFVGMVSYAEVGNYRKAADIFVCPSRSEGLGNAFLSAMAARLPVIATQVGGLADYVFDAERNPDSLTTAWAVDPDSPEHIVAAVQDILAYPLKVATVTEAARTMVLEKFNWDTIARNMREKVFARVV
jgi:glycosyltransferase involved in cell wall biosynthesis